MQIGVGLTYWPWTALDEQVELARLADDVGFSSVWVSETWGQDAVGMLAYVAAVTKRIALGAAVVQIPAGKPTAVGMAAAEHAVSDGLVDLVALATTPSALPARLDEFRATGIDTLIAAPFGDRRAVLHHLSKYV
jgi:Luciferase-like monooxygenase